MPYTVAVKFPIIRGNSCARDCSAAVEMMVYRCICPIVVLVASGVFVSVYRLYWPKL